MKNVWRVAFIFVILGIVALAFVLFGWPAVPFGAIWLLVELRALVRDARGDAA